MVHIQKDPARKILVPVEITKGVENRRRLVKHPADVQHWHRVSAKLEHAKSTGDSIPRISEILKCRMGWVRRIELVGIIEDGPPVEFLSECADE